MVKCDENENENEAQRNVVVQSGTADSEYTAAVLGSRCCGGCVGGQFILWCKMPQILRGVMLYEICSYRQTEILGILPEKNVWHQKTVAGRSTCFGTVND